MAQATLTELAQVLEAQRAALMLAGDADGLAALFSKDLYYAHSSGLRDAGPDYIDRFRDKVFVYHRIDSQIEAIIPLGPDAFAANGVVTMAATVAGVERALNSIFLVVWRKEGETWRLVAHQTTPRPSA